MCIVLNGAVIKGIFCLNAWEPPSSLNSPHTHTHTQFNNFTNSKTLCPCHIHPERDVKMRKDLIKTPRRRLKEGGNDGDMQNMLVTKQCHREHALGIICTCNDGMQVNACLLENYNPQRRPGQARLEDFIRMSSSYEDIRAE